MNITLSAGMRKDKGKGASRRLRKQLKVPAIIYGGDSKPINIYVDLYETLKILDNDDIYTSFIDVKVEKKKEYVIIKDLQRHPVKNIVTHIDFQRIDSKVLITTGVPINFVGLQDNEAIRLGAVFNQFINIVEVSCLPKNLPHSIDIDVTALAIGDHLSLTDLVVAKGVQITALNHEDIDAYNQTIASVSAARKIVEEEDDGEDDLEQEAENTEEKSE